MKSSETVKFLAQLVHRGMLDPKTAQAALSHGDPARYLVQEGHVSQAQWREWIETAAGAKPKLTRYELGEPLGEGGEASVFRAVDRQTGDVVALKILRAELSQDSAVVRRFIAEAKLLIELQSDHIVRGYRVAREGATYFSAMEIVEGRNLQDQLADTGPLDEDTALEVVRQVAEGLAYLHDRQLVHRDVKPGNILWSSEERRAVLIDLGFAIGGGEDGAGGGDVETTAGTVHYISPEQARGQDGLDVRADIYSLGATLYHLLIGSLPFAGDSSEEVMSKQVLEALSGAAFRDAELTPQVHFLIEKMMAKEKQIRFQDPRALATEVEAVLAQRRAEAELERPSAERRTRRARPGTRDGGRSGTTSRRGSRGRRRR